MVQHGGEHSEVMVLGLEARFKVLAWEQEERYRLREAVEIGLRLGVQQQNGDE